MDWVLIIFETQVIKKNRPVRPVFPDYLSVSYDCDNINIFIFIIHNIMDTYGRATTIVLIVVKFYFKLPEAVVRRCSSK